jgi:conjugative relaxase-like TrwC/TraI family protein
MLTAKPISVKKAELYFMKGYYLQGASRWSGRGAKILDLNGAIDNQKVFSRILSGYSPSGRKRLTGKKIPIDRRRAATDCTFSAPKSVSLTALVGGDFRLIDAHRKAVAMTLEIMEKRYAHTRVRTPDGRIIVNTGNLVIGQFDHIETRELDPHLHTHCLVMNMTELEKGKWYSQLNEAIMSNRKTLGMIYQHYLAIEVQKLGYEIEHIGNGQFDLKGYSEKDLMDFSKRRQQILEAAGVGASNEQRDRCWALTRKSKEYVQPEELFTKWREQASQLGISIVQPTTKIEIQENLISQQNLDDAISHCSERAVAFKQEDLEKFILCEGKPMDIKQIEPAILSSEELLKVPESDKVRFTTQKALQRELSTIRMMQQGKDAVEAISDPDLVETLLARQSLTTGQREAIATALTTTDQFIAWQGVAGAGKTYALKQFKEIAQQSGYRMKGFAPSAEAAKVLADEVGIETNTVASLLCSKSPNQFEPNQIWVIDEAGLLSTAFAYDLLQRAVAQKARIIFVGDTRQLSAVEAGNPFKSLQQAGIKTAFLEQSLRQRTPYLQVAVDLIAGGEIEKGFARLDESGCIEELSTDEEKIERIAADYLAIAPSQRNETLVLAGTNYERLSITQRIRDGLKAEGNLGKSTNLTQLKAKDLTSVQMKYVHNFEIGDMVMPLKSYKKRGLQKRKLYQVIDKTPNTLTLGDENGLTIQVDPSFEKAVFSPIEIEIASGDRLRWTKNDRDARRRNGQEFRVLKIERATATIQYADGTQENLDLTVPLHLDYAIVSTTYSSQGKTANRVLIAADHTVASESFYVAVSRVKDELKLYTTDKEEILDKACVSKAKENPLEVLQRNLVREKVSISVGERTNLDRVASQLENRLDVAAREENQALDVDYLVNKPTRKTNDCYDNSVVNDSKIVATLDQPSDEEKIPDNLERQRQLYRLAYEDLARRVKQLPEFAKASLETVDTAIAIAVLGQSKSFDEVERILTQCDLARQWHIELSPEQVWEKLSQYIEEICQTASEQLKTVQHQTKDLER